MPKHLPTLALFLAHVFTQCQPPTSEVPHVFPYDFAKPSKTIELKKELREISGLAYWNKDTLVSIEDEHGILYFISAKNGSILLESKFGDDGDYEGVAVVKDKVFVLKSNGDIYRVKNPLNKKPKTDKLKTSLSSSDDAEGLCYLKKEKTILIAAKEHGEHKGKRLIYELQKGENDIEKKPFLKIDEDEVIARVHKKYGDKWGNNFKPSGIAVHPKTGDLYILSGVNSLLATFSKEKELIDAIRLPKEYANQPEGICFAPDGTLFISTEGGGGKAKLTKLKMKRR